MRIRSVVEELRVHGDRVVLLGDEELAHGDSHVAHLKLHLDLLSRHGDRLQFKERRHRDEDGDNHAKYGRVQASVGFPLNLTN